MHIKITSAIVFLLLLLFSFSCKKNQPKSDAVTATSRCSGMALGDGADLGTSKIFSDDDVWNLDITTANVDASSTAMIAAIGNTAQIHPNFGTTYNSTPIGFQYTVVSGTQALVPMVFTWTNISDVQSYPFPATAPIQGGTSSTGDRHVMVIDKDNCILYETFGSYPLNGGANWHVNSAGIFNLNANSQLRLKPGSPNAAGTADLAGVVRYEEVYTLKTINHALEFATINTRTAYVAPANNCASNSSTPTDPTLLPMGAKLRLKASFDISTYSTANQVILTALKRYGMILTDNSGTLPLQLNGVYDARWNDTDIAFLRNVTAQNFEVVSIGTVGTSCPR